MRRIVPYMKWKIKKWFKPPTRDVLGYDIWILWNPSWHLIELRQYGYYDNGIPVNGNWLKEPFEISILDGNRNYLMYPLLNVYVTNWKDPPIFDGKIHYKSLFSIVFCMFTRSGNSNSNVCHAPVAIQVDHKISTIQKCIGKYINTNTIYKHVNFIYHHIPMHIPVYVQ